MARLLSNIVRFSIIVTIAEAMDASSRAGQKLLANSRLLAENKNERDISWVPNYSIQFEKCHSLIQVAGNQEGGEENRGQLYNQHLVEFALCPTDSCTSGSACKNGAKYITNLREFAQLYTEYEEEVKQAKCEAIRQYCYNDDEVACYTKAGMEECIEVEGQEEVNMEEYMECQLIENGNNNNKNNNQNYNYGSNAYGGYYSEYYVGPYCSSNGKKVHLGVFLDQGCSVPAESGAYERLNYGATLPYSTTSLISSDCISCAKVDENQNNNNNNNNNYNYNNNNNYNQEAPEITEMCEDLYYLAGRCESGLSISYPDTTACEFINNVLPKLEGASKSLVSKYGINTGAAIPTICSFVFGAIAIVLAVYSFLLYRRLRRTKVALNPDSLKQDGTMA